jgi:hypothetical protein
MSCHDLFGIADGGEVGFGVPAEKELEIDVELVVNSGWELESHNVGGEEFGDVGRVH